MFTNWAAIESAAAWELAATAAALELECDRAEVWANLELERADIWALIDQWAQDELERDCRCHGTPEDCAANCDPALCGCPGQLASLEIVRVWTDSAKTAGPAPTSVPRDQLSLFGAASSPAASVVSAIDDFHGPCVVCGESGRRRNTMPAAIAAVLPPIEPTCASHELVCDWGVPLSADQASGLLLGQLPGTPTFRYRAVYGSKEAKAARKTAA